MKYFTLISTMLFAGLQVIAQPNSAMTLANAGFVENRGQVIDQRGKMNKDVLFIYANGNFNLQLKKNGFSYELFEDGKTDATASVSGSSFHKSSESPGQVTDRIYHSHRVDVLFQRATHNIQLEPVDPTGTAFNFYTANTGENGITGVPSFNEVFYRNVYPGIDLRFYLDGDQQKVLKYEWLIGAAADPSQIQLQYKGDRKLSLTAEGTVNIETDLGMITENNIYAYYTGDHKEIPASYLLTSNNLSYKTEAKGNKPFVIDPNITWFSYFGGAGDEDIFESEMSLDANENPILTGNTNSTQYIASSGAFQATYAGGLTDAFIAKFKSAGKMNWCTYYGSTEKDGGHAITADAQNYIYVGGNTYSPSGIATPGAHQTVFGGDMDAFLLKLDPNGIRIWCTYYGGAGFGDQINGVICDHKGNVFFGGYTASFENIATPGALQDTLNGIDYYSGDAMLGEFTPSGKLVWCTYYSGPGQDRVQSIALGKGKDIYFQGTCESAIQFATPGTHQTIYGGGPEDAWISKWDTNGNLFWCSYYGGEGEEHSRGMHTDAAGNAYIVGWTNSLTGMASPGAYQQNLNLGFNGGAENNPDGYLAKFKSDGSLLWSTYYGGKGVDRARGLSIDETSTYVYLSGSTASGNNVGADGGLFQDNLDGTDGYVAKFTADGERIWGYYAGGKGDQVVFDTELDSKNFLYLYMITDSVFATSAGVYQISSHGGQEIMLTKISVSDSCFDALEPNNNPQSAKLIVASPDQAFYGYNGVIFKPTDVDWYSISLQPTNLKIQLTDLADDYDLFLYKDNGQQLVKSSTNTGIADETIILNNTPKKKYWIKVTHNGTSFQPTACYRLIPRVSTVPWVSKLNEANGNAAVDDYKVQVYPNPAQGNLSLKITSPACEMLELRITDQMGRERFLSTLNAATESQSLSLDVHNYPAGVYFVEVRGNSGNVKTKFIIQQ
jgi:hypothetical protein